MNFAFLRVRFCEIVESSVESAELWNRWLIEAGKGKRTLLLAKAKSSKNFCAFRARFCDFALCV